jgi:hypothetical protein
MKRDAGLTLIEMVVTLMLSSLFVLVISVIVISANDWWTRTGRNVMLEDDMRYAKRRISWLMRTADNSPFKITGNKSVTFNTDEEITVDKGRVIHIDGKKGQQEIILTNVDAFDVSDDLYLLGFNKDQKSVVMFSIAASTRATNNPDSTLLTSSATFIVKNRNSGT